MAIAAACSSGTVSDSTTTVAESEPTSVELELAGLQAQIDDLEAQVAASATPVTGASGPYTITLSDYTIEGDLAVRPGTVTFELENAGTTAHNMVISGFAQAPDLAAGRSATWTVEDLVEGTYFVYCSLSDHRLRGMSATLVVDDAAGTTHEHEALDYEAMSAAMTAAMLAFPDGTPGRGNQLLEPRIGTDGAKEFDLTASIIDWEVSPERSCRRGRTTGRSPAP